MPDEASQPEWISSAVLTKKAETSEVFMKKELNNAVLTFPENFNDLQDFETKLVCKLRIQNSPNQHRGHSRYNFLLTRQKSAE